MCGGIFGPTAVVIVHWFKKHRGLAMGIVAVGSSVGGVVLPVVTKSLSLRVTVCLPENRFLFMSNSTQCKQSPCD